MSKELSLRTVRPMRCSLYLSVKWWFFGLATSKQHSNSINLEIGVFLSHFAWDAVARKTQFFSNIQFFYDEPNDRFISASSKGLCHLRIWINSNHQSFQQLRQLIKFFFFLSFVCVSESESVCLIEEPKCLRNKLDLLVYSIFLFDWFWIWSSGLNNSVNLFHSVFIALWTKVQSPTKWSVYFCNKIKNTARKFWYFVAKNIKFIKVLEWLCVSPIRCDEERSMIMPFQILLLLFILDLNSVTLSKTDQNAVLFANSFWRNS